MQEQRRSAVDVMSGIVCACPYAMSALLLTALVIAAVSRFTPGPTDAAAFGAAIILTPATALCWMGRAVANAKQHRIDQLAAALAAERSTRH